VQADDRDGNGSEPRSLEQLLLAGLGWLSLGVEAADGLADDLAHRVGVEREEMRAAVHDTITSWKAEADRVGLKRGETSDRLIARLGLVRRDELDDLQLRLAQLEHRLRLVERPPAGDA
jgi:polyhydroxyalkanoate synthesis regulator phasin